MSRAEKRRREKMAGKAAAAQARQASPPSPQQAANISRGIALAVGHHNAGELAQAKAVYQQVLQIDPNQPDALHLLGVLAYQTGAIDAAVELSSKAIGVQPDHADAHKNLGSALWRQGKLAAAVPIYQAALELDPDCAATSKNLGTVQLELGLYDAAEASFSAALRIKPDYAEAHRDLATALKCHGKLDQAIQALQRGLEHLPGNTLITQFLIDTLNYYTPEAGPLGPHAQAQTELRAVTPNLGDGPITDAAVEALYQQSRDILEHHGLTPEPSSFQIYRGATIERTCARHMTVYNTFKTIPEYCFGCFKVTIQPPTVVDLFKLALVFDSLDLPGDPTRKCHVEVRSGVAGAYKGWVYCQTLDEANEIAATLQTVINEKISPDIKVLVKRGCSEFLSEFPDFGRVDESEAPLMTYEESWRENEAKVDANMDKHKLPAVFKSHNHTGLTLLDALIMRSWLAYAAQIGDESYLRISGTPVDKMPIDDRPPFQPPGPNHV